MGGLRIIILTLDTETALYTEDRGLQVPMVLEHDYIPHTYKCFFRSYDLLDLSTLILSGNKTHTTEVFSFVAWFKVCVHYRR